MNLRIINPEVIENLYENHGQFACKCYDTDEKYAERVGKKCNESGHMSGSRCEYIKFEITDIDRGTAEQMMRHVVGTDTPYDFQGNYNLSELSEKDIDINPSRIVNNMASFRYIDKDGFKYYTPDSIKNTDSALIWYNNCMDYLNKTRSFIKQELMYNGVPEKQAIEDVNFLLPRATTSTLMIGFTPEALIHFCHKRLCFRAQKPIREVAQAMKSEIKKYNEDFANELVPHCEFLLWCPEKDASCGYTFTREKILEILENDVK